MSIHEHKQFQKLLKMKTNNCFKIFKQMITILAFLGFAVWMSGCKKESSSSDIIDPNLLGTWKSVADMKLLVLNNNHMFLDSVFLDSVFWGRSSLRYAFQGHYNVKDGYIQLEDINMTYYFMSSDTNQSNLTYFSPNLKIYQLNKNQLILTPTLIMTTKSVNNDTLRGLWSTNFLVAAFDPWQNPHFVNGNDLRQYTFFTDSLLVKQNLHYGNQYDTNQYGFIPYHYVTADSINIGNPPYDSYKVLFNDPLLYLMSKNEIYKKMK
jgi:hypothetical protein